jgi:hypothetical protein
MAMKRPRSSRLPRRQRPNLIRVRRRMAQPSHYDLPASDDPVWIQLGREVLSNLGTPKTVSQLKSWARGERLEIGRLVNALAWLDTRGLVYVDKTTVEPLWKRSDVPLPTQLQPVPPSTAPSVRGR